MKRLTLALVALAFLGACREQVRVRVVHRTADAGATQTSTVTR